MASVTMALKAERTQAVTHSSSVAAAKFDENHESTPVVPRHKTTHRATKESKLVPTFQQIFAKGKYKNTLIRTAVCAGYMLYASRYSLLRELGKEGEGEEGLKAMQR